jgi:hypothetical protein
VLRDPELLCVYAPDGQVYEVALPCHAQRLWALGKRGGGGLLIQRQPVRWLAMDRWLVLLAVWMDGDGWRSLEDLTPTVDYHIPPPL